LPTQTFFNLPQGKQKRVMDAALAEFAAKPFHNASVASIVEAADIPRGSFYQYFEDLEDLYLHLFEIIGKKKRLYMQEVVSEKKGAMNQIRSLYSAGLQFARDHPKLASLGIRFFREDRSFRRRLIAGFEESSMQFLQDMLISGQEAGEIDPAVDAETAAFVLHSLNVDVVDHYLEGPHSAEELIHESSEYLSLVNSVLYIIEQGLIHDDECGGGQLRNQEAGG